MTVSPEMESDQLLEAIIRGLRAIRAGTGYGRLTVTLRLERDAEIETSVTERVAA